MTDIAKVAITADTTGLKKGQVALTNFKKVGNDTEKSIMRNTARIKGSFNSVAPAVKGAGSAAATAAPKMQGFGHQARMVSMQLSQVAQQGSVTGNYLQALAIQLPDLMLGFGALGIMVGAVAGSLASYFIGSLKDSEDAAGELLEEISDLTDGYKNLTAAQKELIRINLEPEIEKEIVKRDKALESVKNYTKWVAMQTDNVSKLKRASSIGKWGEVETLEHFAKRVKESKDNLKELEDGLINSQTAYDNAQIKIDKYNETISDPSGSGKKRAEAVNNIIRGLADEASALELSESQMLKRELMLNDATEAEIRSALAIQKSIQAIKDKSAIEADLQALEQSLESPAARAQRQYAEQLAVIKAAEAQQIESIKPYNQLKEELEQQHSDRMVAIKKQEEAQKLQILSANQQAGLGIVGNLFGQMADIARQGGEEQFQEYKNFASAQAAVSTALAVNNALAVAPTPVGIALASVVGAMGVAQIAMIQGQQYQGARAMGGQVEGSGRYLVGENGPEVLQLGAQGGSITPNHALQGGGPSVTNVFNIQSGVTRQEVAGLIPTIVNATKQAVKSDMSSGGSMSKAVGRRA